MKNGSAPLLEVGKCCWFDISFICNNQPVAYCLPFWMWFCVSEC